MKRFILVILFFTVQQSMACDICGCGNGGSFFGVLPQSHVRFLGMRYKVKNFDSHLNSKNFKAAENFQSAELWGRLYPFKKTQLLFFAPYNWNEQYTIESQKTVRTQGFGDISSLVHYNVVNTFTDTTKLREWNHNLLAGGGIKLPTGRYEYDPTDISEVANPNFQLGTGSWDVPLNVIYTLTHKSSGLNVNLNYKINTTNAAGYRFANRSNVSTMLFHNFSFSQSTVMLLGGVYGEHGRMDLDNGERNEFTGGGFVAGSGGIEVYLPKISFGVNGQIPIAQNLSNGELRLRNAFNVHLTRMF